MIAVIGRGVDSGKVAESRDPVFITIYVKLCRVRTELNPSERGLPSQGAPSGLKQIR